MYRSVRMKPSPFSALRRLASQALAGLLALAAAGAVAQTTLHAPSDRISDAAIAADQRGFEALQARIKALNEGGRPLRDAHLAAAQCWLDTGFHEYTRNDRGPWPQAAVSQAESLVRAMESRQPLPAETPLLAGAERVRPDLWLRAAVLRRQPGWACAQAKAACGEVELVHAGHEQAQLGWRHARPYVQIAEDLIGEAEALAARCEPPPVAGAGPVARPVAETRSPAVVALAPAAVTPAPAAPAVSASASASALPAGVHSATTADPAELILFGQVVFGFDGESLSDVPRGGMVTVQAMLQVLREQRLQLQAVELHGHADRLNASRRSGYNDELSARRVAALREHLVAQGVPAGLVRVQSHGDRLPREACQAPLPRGLSLQECLLPNRRVEIRFLTRRP